MYATLHVLTDAGAVVVVEPMIARDATAGRWISLSC
jgi:hypothetical protein